MSQNWILSENKDYLGKAQKMEKQTDLERQTDLENRTDLENQTDLENRTAPENRITGEKLDELRAFFAQDRFATENGAYVEEAGENYAKCSMELTDRHKNARGAVMGGVHFVLADFTFAVATNCMGQSVVSLSSNITYTGKVKGNKLIGTAHCIKEGRSTNFYEITIEDEYGNQAAVVTITGFHVGDRK